jgi:two-component system, LytTR family, response regulator LytT
MNVVIIEDEKILAEELGYYITSLRKDWKIIKTLHSVREALAWFSDQPQYQLIFSDIQLGDGSSLDIFRQLRPLAPVIFCTAYNEYAIDAFKNRGIDYILKPLDQQSIEEAIIRYESLKETMGSGRLDFDRISALFYQANEEKASPSSLLVNVKDKIIPVKMEDVALFYIHNGTVFLLDFKKGKYVLPHTVDELEQLAGGSFYRADRQHLVNRKAIRDVSQYFARKLLLNLLVEYPTPVTIRKEKAPEFLEWLTTT